MSAMSLNAQSKPQNSLCSILSVGLNGALTNRAPEDMGIIIEPQNLVTFGEDGQYVVCPT